MPAQDLESFLNKSFLENAKQALHELGFVSDEHSFAPYRETLSVHVSEIARALKKEGWKGNLVSGFLKDHPKAGFAYFIYDSRRFGSGADAAKAVSSWLDRQYSDEVQK